SVTVLTGERAVVVGDQLGGTGDELTPLPQALGRVEDEGDAAVEAPLPEMTVERGLIVELLEQAAEVPQVIADPFHRYGGVLPSGVGLTHARNMRGRTQPCFAYLPQLLRLPVLLEDLAAEDCLLLLAGGDEPVGLSACIGLLIGTELDEQETPAFGQQL